MTEYGLRGSHDARDGREHSSFRVMKGGLPSLSHSLVIISNLKSYDNFYPDCLTAVILVARVCDAGLGDLIVMVYSMLD